MAVSKKGLSPLFAVVLLIAISITLITMISGWAILFTNRETGYAFNDSKKVRECGVLTVDAVYLDFIANTGRVFVKGAQTDTIINASLQSDTAQEMTLTTSLPLEVDGGRTNVLGFTLTGDLTNCDAFDHATISTNCVDITFDQAPRCA